MHNFRTNERIGWRDKERGKWGVSLVDGVMQGPFLILVIAPGPVRKGLIFGTRSRSNHTEEGERAVARQTPLTRLSTE